jgi:hypothetical protein
VTRRIDALRPIGSAAVSSAGVAGATDSWGRLRLGCVGTCEDLLPRAETLMIGGRPVLVIGLEDLIRIKRHLGRSKDMESRLQLEAIKRLRDEEGLR